MLKRLVLSSKGLAAAAGELEALLMHESLMEGELPLCDKDLGAPIFCTCHNLRNHAAVNHGEVLCTPQNRCIDSCAVAGVLIAEDVFPAVHTFQGPLVFR